jgi:hypothetical protein
MLVKRTSITKSGKYKKWECKSCKFEHSISGPDIDNLTPEQILACKPCSKRRLSDEDAIKIRDSLESKAELARRYGIAHSMVYQIQQGIAYRDLLPENWRRPPGPNDPSCERCREWRGLESADPCRMGFPDPAIEGVGFARDCSVYVVG